MPFSNDSGAVSGFLQKHWQGDGARADDSRAVRRGDAGSFFTESLGAGEKGIASGRAGGCGAIATSETGAFSGQLIEMWGLEASMAVARDIAIAEIIRHDHDDIRLPLLRPGNGNSQQEDA